MYANPQLEQMAPDELHALQLQRLKKTVAWAYEKSGIYKRKFDAAGVKPEDIHTLDDIEKLPFRRCIGHAGRELAWQEL